MTGLTATQTLPGDYTDSARLDLSKDTRAVILLNLAAIPLLLLAGFGVIAFVSAFRAESGLTFEIRGAQGVVALILLYAAMIVIHEAFHGIAFWYYTRSRPTFGISLRYAYAAAPDWFIPRRSYLVVALAPFFGITIFGLLLMGLGPAPVIFPAGFVIATNAAGCVGDFTVVGWLLRKPAETLIRDEGDAMTIYMPSRRASE
ncbi:MAG: DUF3267 domain-containing protein [Chloroflexota bacterium]